MRDAPSAAKRERWAALALSILLGIALQGVSCSDCSDTRDAGDTTAAALSSAAVRKAWVDGNLQADSCGDKEPAVYAVLQEACKTGRNWQLSLVVYNIDCNQSVPLSITADNVPEGPGGVVDAPLYLNNYTLGTWAPYNGADVATCPTVVQVIQQEASLAYLRSAINNTGLTERLQAAADAGFSLFLPSDSALEAYAASANIALSDLMETKDAVALLFVNSFLGKAYSAQELRNGATYTTAGGSALLLTSVPADIGAILNGCTGQQITMQFTGEDAEAQEAAGRAGARVRVAKCPDPRLKCQSAIFITDDVMLPVPSSTAGDRSRTGMDSSGDLYTLISAAKEDPKDVLDRLFPPPEGSEPGCTSLYLAAAATQDTHLWRQLLEQSKVMAPYTQRRVAATLLLPTDAAVREYLSAAGITFEQLRSNQFLVESMVFGHSFRAGLKPSAISEGMVSTTYGVYPLDVTWSLLPAPAPPLPSALLEGPPGSTPAPPPPSTPANGRLGRGCPTPLSVSMGPDPATAQVTKAWVLQCGASCAGHVYVIDGVLEPQEIRGYLATYPGLQGAEPKGEACGSLSEAMFFRNDTMLTYALAQQFAPEVFAQLGARSTAGTFLAPTDDAWVGWAAALNTTLGELIPAAVQKGQLPTILQYALLPAERLVVGTRAQQIPSGLPNQPLAVVSTQSVPSGAGAAGSIDGDSCDELFSLVQGFASNATVVACDAGRVCTGSLHLVDTILLPQLPGLDELLPLQADAGLAGRGTLADAKRMRRLIT